MGSQKEAKRKTKIFSPLPGKTLNHRNIFECGQISKQIQYKLSIIARRPRTIRNRQREIGHWSRKKKNRVQLKNLQTYYVKISVMNNGVLIVIDDVRVLFVKMLTLNQLTNNIVRMHSLTFWFCLAEPDEYLLYLVRIE